MHERACQVTLKAKKERKEAGAIIIPHLKINT